MNRIIDWLIIRNSRVIMLQSLCGNIHRTFEFSSNSERETHPGKLQGKSLGMLDSLGCYRSEMEGFNISFSFANKPWKTDSPSCLLAEGDVKLEISTLTCGCLKIYPIFLRKGSHCLNTLARIPKCTGWPV